MKVVNKSIARKQVAAVAALLAFFVATSAGASAKHGSAKPAPQQASVIAHVLLPGTSASQLVLQQHDGKQYLYVEQASKQGFAIVDVTKPDQPKIIGSEAWPNEASTGKLQMVGGRLALAEASDAATTENISLTETLKVLDLSDPANPRTILTFSGVTSTLADDDRNLVYITNTDGLWVLKHQPEQTMSPAMRACRSEDASNDASNCQ